ncbi:MAG: tRNA (N6-threonylcarbamoyladenosine(37)-N6)-methyltransferase TrmO [Ignavibacteria bacterium]|nr:MAG: tRNA (N6-threonylcarbamoyladenosine(37)-N6)-methyltransferase TrmO [Ignavibacteria bacterium]
MSYLLSMTSYTFHPIGVVSSPRKHRYDVPRQGTLDETHEARILLHEGHDFEQALSDLQGFDRIWLLYVFHLNEGWKPRVRVPRHRQDKVGVFATRAPYRPNPIGLSCVNLLEVEGLVLRVSECDLLDGTPILDIKPYLPYADSFPEAATGWVPEDEKKYTIRFSSDAMEQMLWLRSEDIDLLPFVETQLEAAPLDSSRKRIARHLADETLHHLAYRTWRIIFGVDEDNMTVQVEGVATGYRAEELESDHDPYEDKAVHRAFIGDFPEARLPEP